MELKINIEDMKRSKVSKGGKHTPYVYVPKEWQNQEVVILLVSKKK